MHDCKTLPNKENVLITFLGKERVHNSGFVPIFLVTMRTGGCKERGTLGYLINFFVSASFFASFKG